MEVATEIFGNAEALKAVDTLATPTTDSISDLPKVAAYCCNFLESLPWRDLTHRLDFWAFVGAARSLQAIAYRLKVDQTPIPDWIYLECDIKCDLPCDADRVRDVIKRVLDLLDELAGKVCTMQEDEAADGSDGAELSDDGSERRSSSWDGVTRLLLDPKRYHAARNRVQDKSTVDEVQQSFRLWHPIAVRRGNKDVVPTALCDDVDDAMLRLLWAAEQLDIDATSIRDLGILEDKLRAGIKVDDDRAHEVGEAAIHWLVTLETKSMASRRTQTQPGSTSGTNGGGQEEMNKRGKPPISMYDRCAQIELLHEHLVQEKPFGGSNLRESKKRIRNWIGRDWDTKHKDTGKKWWDPLPDAQKKELSKMRAELQPILNGTSRRRGHQASR